MQVNRKIFDHYYKQLGLQLVNQSCRSEINSQEPFKSLIRILLLPPKSSLTIDFEEFYTQQTSLFFVNANQFLHINSLPDTDGYLIFYNRDFYCVQIHDAEVACDGLLFNNIYKIPMLALSALEETQIAYLFKQIDAELSLVDSAQEEMIRTLLKQILLKALRIFKTQLNNDVNLPISSELDFFRQFSQLVETHYKTKHSVADYADLLNMVPKTITHRFKKHGFKQPNDLIKDRILLEAKRLLLYTSLSTKEIAYHLGYDDPAYFNRLFHQKIGLTTHNFKKQHHYI